MKRFISFLCAAVILFGVIEPIFSTDVSAGYYGSWLDDYWVCTGGHKIINNSTIQLLDNTRLSHTYIWRPKKYAIEFTLAVLTPSNSVGFQGKAGAVRSGGYIRNGIFRNIVDGNSMVETPNNCDGEYHTYRLEIDHVTNKQKIYYDGSYAGEWDLPVQQGNSYSTDEFYFWTSNGAEIAISNVSFTSLMNGQGYEFPTDYTQAYFEDYTYSEADYLAGTTACRVPEGNWNQYFKCDAENGTVSVYREKIAGSTYVEHPLKATKNFDWEFRLKQTKVDESLNQGGLTIRISTDSRYTWLKTGTGVISFRCYGEDASDPYFTGPTHAIVYNIGYDWFNLKAEVRDKWITWYIQKDGDAAYKELVKYRMMDASMNLWSTAVGIDSSTAGTSCGFIIDWERYTPYFEDSFYITSPASNAEFTEGDSVSLDVNLADSGIGGQGNYRKTVDYYLNGIKVGTGNYNGKFVYTLTGLKPGVYKLKAVCSDGNESAEVPFTVKKSYSISGSEKIDDDLGMAFFGKADDKWYTYKIVVGDFGGNKSFKENNDEFITVYRKERGAADSEYQKLTGIAPPYDERNMYTYNDIKNTDYLYGANFSTISNKLFLGYYGAKYDIAREDKVATKYSVDNIQFTNDDLAYSGYVTETDAEIFVDSAEKIEAIVLASYDENNVLVDIDFAELNSGTNFADLDIKAGSVTRLYMWNKITAGKPIIDEPIEMGN